MAVVHKGGARAALVQQQMRLLLLLWRRLVWVIFLWLDRLWLRVRRLVWRLQRVRQLVGWAYCWRVRRQLLLRRLLRWPWRLLSRLPVCILHGGQLAERVVVLLRVVLPPLLLLAVVVLLLLLLNLLLLKLRVMQCLLVLVLLVELVVRLLHVQLLQRLVRVHGRLLWHHPRGLHKTRVRRSSRRSRRSASAWDTANNAIMTRTARTKARTGISRPLWRRGCCVTTLALPK